MQCPICKEDIVEGVDRCARCRSCSVITHLSTCIYDHIEDEHADALYCAGTLNEGEFVESESDFEESDQIEEILNGKSLSEVG